jgi:hypothetical protein
MPRIAFHQTKWAKDIVNSHPMNQTAPPKAPDELHLFISSSFILLLLNEFLLDKLYNRGYLNTPCMRGESEPFQKAVITLSKRLSDTLILTRTNYHPFSSCYPITSPPEYLFLTLREGRSYPANSIEQIRESAY